MLQICNTYSQCCLWFPFSAKIWLFISCCLRPTVACLTFSHKIVVFRLQNDLINILQCLQIIHCLYFELKNSIVRSLILSLTFAWHHVFIALQWLHSSDSTYMYIQYTVCSYVIGTQSVWRFEYSPLFNLFGRKGILALRIITNRKLTWVTQYSKFGGQP